MTSRGALLMLLALSACDTKSRGVAGAGAGPGGARATAVAFLFANQAVPRISIIAVPLRDTFALGSPIEIAYFVRNGPTRMPFRNDPEFYHFTIMGPDGVAMTPLEGPEPGSLGSVPDLVLPARGIVGGVVDLSCARPGFATQAVTDEVCSWKYDFRSVGRYRMVAHYQSVAPPTGIGGGVSSVELRSDTAEFAIVR